MIGDTAIATMLFNTRVGKGEAQAVATTANIRKAPSNMKEHIKTLSFDIVVFCEYVNGLVLQNFNGCGQDTVADLLVHLFDSYLTVPNTILKETIGQKLTKYHLGQRTIDYEELKSFATTAVNVSKGEMSIPWLQKSEELQQIEALTAELDTFKKNQANKQRVTRKSKHLVVRRREITRKVTNPITKNGHGRMWLLRNKKRTKPSI